MYGFVQHLEPRAYVRNDRVVSPPHSRSVKKMLACLGATVKIKIKPQTLNPEPSSFS
jgi:hypothetical protein